MKSTAFVAFLLICCALAVVAARSTAQPREVAPDSGAARIQALLEERRATLHQLVRTFEAKFRAGVGGYDAVIHATNQLLEVELELAKTTEERLSIHEQRVKNLKELEEIMRKMQQAAVVGAEGVLAAKAARLNAEIALLRERTGAN